ncbi:hypothetical protein Scep_013630 [Stephania cephalantha]|uniref:Uncharacterized protein n=1 Tax=Stephania cephalantha TaxID=152367 RepID=A0AAP0JJN0_9MAGN
MGCITSKVLTRSGSFQEELRHSLRRRDSKKGFPIATNISGGHHQHFPPLVYSSNSSSLPTILQSANYSDDDDDDNQQHYASATNVEPIDHYLGTKKVAATWAELLAGLEKVPHTLESANINADAPKRSKSFDWSFGEPELSIQGSSIVDDKADNRGVERCRSFHTVEEYEKLLVKANSSSCIEASFNIVDDQEVKNKSEFSVIPDPPELVVTIYSHNHTYDSVEVVEPDEPTTNFEDTISKRSADHVLLVKEKAAGSRRKAMAKELASLKIPSTMELPSIASLKEWVVQVEEQVAVNASPPQVSADAPKFGSFDLSSNTSSSSSSSNYKCNGEGEDEGDGDGDGDGGSAADSNYSNIFDPEMLSAIEEAMQQLDTEEENVVKLIEDADINY